MTLPQVENTTDAKLLWLAKNRGILTRLREEFETAGDPLSRTTIRRVFWGEIKTAGRRVERRLAELGAPGFEEEAVAA